MAKRWIAIASMVVGAAILTVPIQVLMNRRAFTSDIAHPMLPEMTMPSNPETTRTAASEQSSETNGARFVETNGARFVELPPVEIRAPLPRPDRDEPAERTPEPCSPWTEIGPKYVTDGIGNGTRRVRQLC